MRMCQSTYYYKALKKEDNSLQIVDKIEKIIEELPQSGYRPVTTILKKEMTINHKRTLRIMRENNLICVKKRKFISKTTESKHKFKKYPNLAKDFVPTDINQLIVGDVTAFDQNGKNLYLASLLDVCNRKTIGSAVSDKNNTELVLAALEDAVMVRGNLENCIHHTDSDVRYCSDEYISRLEKYKMKISMCVGNVYENAYAESFNSTIKRQEINISEYTSKEDAALSIFEFIRKYNTIRPHSALGGLTPSEKELVLLSQKKSKKG